MFEQITIEGKKYNLVPVEEQERILICDINGKKYYLGPEADMPMSWEQAKRWAASVGGQLMSREVGILAFKKAEIRNHFHACDWYWLEDDHDPSHGWVQGFYNGHQYTNLKPSVYRVRAVFVE